MCGAGTKHNIGIGWDLGTRLGIETIGVADII